MNGAELRALIVQDLYDPEPDDVLALLDVVEAAEAWRYWSGRTGLIPNPPEVLADAVDAFLERRSPVPPGVSE